MNNFCSVSDSIGALTGTGGTANALSQTARRGSEMTGHHC